MQIVAHEANDNSISGVEFEHHALGIYKKTLKLPATKKTVQY
jgi:hypothetical protein